MARYKPYDYSQLQMIPVALADQLVPGTLEYALHYLVEHRLNLAVFDARYANDQTGCRAYAPKVLLKVILLGYARGLLSSRRVQRWQRQADRIVKYLAKHEPKLGRSGNEVQSNVTDNESAKLASAHGVMQGYNANAVVDAKHQVVVYAAAYGQGDDAASMAP